MNASLRYAEPIRRRLRVPEDELFDDASKVVEVIRKAGHEAYLVGGSIRDLVMKQRPSDYDVATSAEPAQIQKLFSRTVDVGIEFGTVMVLWHKHSFEVTTFRNDGRYLDGRRPTSVSWASVTDDVQRRDFTINGLLYDPLTFEVIDYVGGLEDIEKKELKTIGDPFERFQEDRLRMLRAIRFVARLGFSLDPEVKGAIQAMAYRIQDVSVERIQTEIAKMLRSPAPDRALELLHDTRLLASILPNFQGAEAAIPRFRAAVSHALGSSEAFFLALLFYGLDLRDTETFLREMRWSNDVIRAVLDLLDVIPQMRSFPTLTIARQKRLLRLGFASEIFALAEALLATSDFPPDALALAKDRCRLWDKTELSPDKLLSGSDLKRLGLQPGPAFKILLETLEDAQLEGQIQTREDAERWILHTASSSPHLRS